VVLIFKGIFSGNNISLRIGITSNFIIYSHDAVFQAKMIHDIVVIVILQLIYPGTNQKNGCYLFVVPLIEEYEVIVLEK